MKYKYKKIQSFCFLMCVLFLASCSKDFLELEPRGTTLETNYYTNQAEIFEGLVATYDVLGWSGTEGWTMLTGLVNAASDDCFAGGSDASDQPSWVAWDQFSITPLLGPQKGLWKKYFTGIYRANLILEKIEEVDNLDANFKGTVIAEAKTLRAYFYFDLVRLFGDVPLFTETISIDDVTGTSRTSSREVYAQIERDLEDAIAAPELQESVALADLGRINKNVVRALLGKVILYQNEDNRMLDAAGYFEEVINSGFYSLEPNFGDIFTRANEWGRESIFEIQFASNKPGDFGCCFASGPNQNATEGNFNVQFFGMRDFAGPTFASGWSFCPVTLELVDFMQGDPRFEHTIIDGNVLKQQGASYTEGFQNTDYFIRKYAPISENLATDGETSLGWGDNERAIRLADVLLMAAEAIVRGGGNESTARTYLNQVRSRVGIPTVPSMVSGQDLLDVIYNERRMELATEGHRFFDLVRTGQAQNVLEGFINGTHERLPLPQDEIDLTQGVLLQNPGY